MERSKLQLIFFLAMMGVTLILTFFIFRPFLAPLVVAATFAVIFQPMHRRVEKALPHSPSAAALISVVAVALILLIPLTLFGLQIFREAQQLFHTLSEGGAGSLPDKLPEGIRGQITTLSPNFSLDLERVGRQALDWIMQNLNNIFSSLFGTVLSFFLFLISLFYFLRDGKSFTQYLKILSPLSDRQDEKILSRLFVAVNSVIKGALSIALIQGFLTGIGFWIFGVPNPVLWGSTAAIAALVPNIGTALVLVPAIGFLYLNGEVAQAIGLGIWSITAVGLIDNILGPYLINRGVKIHPLLILLSVIGGLGLFGPVGFLLGPLIISLLFALIDIHFETVGRAD